MASLYIKDPGAADKVRSLARRLGTTQTEAVRRGMAALEQQLGPEAADDDFVQKMREYRLSHPLPPLRKRVPDKEFADWLSGEADVDDVVR